MDSVLRMNEPSNGDLEAAVRPWAEVNRPDAWEKTEKVRPVPSVFRTYLVRLVELMAAADVTAVPVECLEETGVRMKVRLRQTGEEIEVCGKKVVPRIWGFVELDWLYESGVDIATYAAAKRELNLELDDGQGAAEAAVRLRALAFSSARAADKPSWPAPPPPPRKPTDEQQRLL